MQCFHEVVFKDRMVIYSGLTLVLTLEASSAEALISRPAYQRTGGIPGYLTDFQLLLYNTKESKQLIQRHWYIAWTLLYVCMV